MKHETLTLKRIKKISILTVQSQNKLKTFSLKLKERFAEDLQKDLQNQEEQTTQKGRRRGKKK
jgi:hypothetical protein